MSRGRTSARHPVRSLITGITGQDGTYLARELLSRGRTVFGTTSRPPSPSAQPSAIPFTKVDYRDFDGLKTLLHEIQPDEIYHLAGPSFIRDSGEFESEVAKLGIHVTQSLLRWIADFSPATRFFFASSSEVFGDPVESPQGEETARSPLNPYAIAKLAGQHLVDYYRRRQGLFSCTGILFNHESPLRRKEFVSRRITHGAALIAAGKSDRLVLGNLEALRDWSHASDVVRAFRLMLEAESPEDYILASGTVRSVREFCEAAFSVLGLDYSLYVSADSALHRPDFRTPRVGNPRRAKEQLGWKPEVDFRRMVAEMVMHDLLEIQGEGRAVTTA
jgi:GDPmannose 4,6-dehydratase